MSYYNVEQQKITWELTCILLNSILHSDIKNFKPTLAQIEAFEMLQKTQWTSQLDSILPLLQKIILTEKHVTEYEINKLNSQYTTLKMILIQLSQNKFFNTESRPALGLSCNFI